MIGAQVRDTVASNVASYVKASLFLTPGVRWRFTPQRRVSFYAAAGAGVGNFGSYLSYVGSGPGLSESVTGNTTSAAFDWGGGIDFRLTRLLSLRAEGRDFVTRAGLGGFAGRNHAFFMAGIGFHF
jgi:opacity protein-like surface antigen